MQLKVFVLPIKNLGAAEAEMNAFLRGHRVLAVKKEFVPDGENSFWSFCVEYLDGAGAGALLPDGRPKIDYKEVLKPEEFEVLSRLRDWRKSVAEKEGVPVYAVLTNEQLAQMVSEASEEQNRPERGGRRPRREVWRGLGAIVGGPGEGMTRVGQLLAAIADPHNLRLAFWKASKGKRAKADCRTFQESLDTNLSALRAELVAGQVRVGDYHYFTVHDPKERTICAAQAAAGRSEIGLALGSTHLASAYSTLWP